MHSSLLFIKHYFLIDWQTFLFGSEDASFLPEVALRSLLMFLIIIFSLRILGKRSVTQLSVFELGVIIGLGSAAGDPMFYKDVGMLAGLLVFVVIISLYRVLTYFINRSENVEKLMEGEPVYLVEDGKFILENFEKEPIAHQEFFAQLRQHSVAHLGQVQLAIIETNGLISLFYYEDEDVRWGLPVLPHLCAKKLKQFSKDGQYACGWCGQVEALKEKTTAKQCKVCGKDEWVEAINLRRVN
ncbi:MAG: YetF domain-containing protein [Bacteroidota bacterium]|nr:DUF421 domain-containing protein [Ferruginibacter sp.]